MNYAIVRSLPLVALLGITVIATNTVAAAEAPEAKTVIPATAAGIWETIDGHVKDLHRATLSGKLDGVHVHAYAVRDLVRALPAHSPNLSAGALAKVNAQSKFVDTLAERLDQTGDANDKAGTAANLKKLEGVLRLLRVQYPVSK